MSEPKKHAAATAKEQTQASDDHELRRQDKGILAGMLFVAGCTVAGYQYGNTLICLGVALACVATAYAISLIGPPHE